MNYTTRATGCRNAQRALTAAAALVTMVAPLSCAKGLRIGLSDQRIRKWVVVLDGDTFVAYMITPAMKRTSSVVPPSPPKGCKRQPIGRVRDFVTNELWLPASVEVVPVARNEAYTHAVAAMVRHANPVVMQLSPALESLGDNNEARRYLGPKQAYSGRFEGAWGAGGWRRRPLGPPGRAVEVGSTGCPSGMETSLSASVAAATNRGLRTPTPRHGGQHRSG